MDKLPTSASFWPVLVAALGYFVDVFDLWLFANNRIVSVRDMGVSPESLTITGAQLINAQQFGLLLGGMGWGVLGDKFGRAKVLFGSIALYSLATFANGFVTSLDQYLALRFLAGLGLAGEIGVGVTLVLETLPTDKRGLGIAIVTSIGLSGALFAALATKIMPWRSAYIFGGTLGIALLLLRWLVSESPVFLTMRHQQKRPQGSLLLLFSSYKRCVKFLGCIAIGLPLYLCFGIFVTFAPEIQKGLASPWNVEVADALMWASISLTVGDLMAGILSQWLRSRKAPIRYALCAGLFFCIACVVTTKWSSMAYLTTVSAMAFATGYWTCLITTTAEQFGTNLRSTVSAMVPNLVRASVIVMNMFFVGLNSAFTMEFSLLMLTAAVYLLAFSGLASIGETFGKELDFYEDNVEAKATKASSQ